MKNFLQKLGLFFGSMVLAIIAMTVFQHGKAYAYDCGYAGGSHAWAGLAINLKVKRHDGTIKGEATNGPYVRVTTDKANTRWRLGWPADYWPPESEPGNIVQMINNADGTHSEGTRYDYVEFGPSSRPDCESVYGQSIWGPSGWGDSYGIVFDYNSGTVLDCDTSIHPSFPQRFIIQPKGTPQGSEPGGTWDTGLADPANGAHEAYTLYYHEPTYWNYVHNSFSTNLNGNTNEVSKILGNTPYNTYANGTVINIHDTPENNDDGDGRAFAQSIQVAIGTDASPDSTAWKKIDSWDRNGIDANTVVTERSVKYTLPSRTINTRVCFRGVISPVAGQSTPKSTITNAGKRYSTVRCVTIIASPSGGFTTEPVISAPTLIPNEEVPTSATFNSGATVDIDGVDKVVGVAITRNWYVERASGGANYPLMFQTITSNNLTGDFNFTTVTLNSTLVAAGVVIGDKVCHDIKIHPGSGLLNASGGIITPYADKYAKKCTTISNKPYVTVYGGDVVVGGGTSGSCDSASRLYAYAYAGAYAGLGRGSGTQFLATAPGPIVFFSSALLRTTGVLPPSGLTYANSPSAVAPYFAVTGGSNEESHCQKDYWSSDKRPATPFTASTINNLSTTLSGTYYYKPPVGQNYITIPASSIPIRTKITLYIEGNAYITGNLTYQNSTAWSATSDIPNLTIITKGNIHIDYPVTQLDGFYVAQPKLAGQDTVANGGRIYTCADANGQISPSLNPGAYIPGPWGGCSLYQLVVNGAFDAQHTRLLRTGSSLRFSVPGEDPSDTTHNCGTGAFVGGNKSVCSAEVFNFSPETYLSSPSNSSVGAYQAITSLPPIL